MITATATAITASSTITTRTCSRSRCVLDGEVDPDKFMPWINRVTQEQGPNILRCKGIVAMKDDPKRFVFQGVHMMLDGDSQREWKPDEKREFEGHVHRPQSRGGGHPRRIPRLRGLTCDRLLRSPRASTLRRRIPSRG